MPSSERFASAYQAKLCKTEAAVVALPDDSPVIFGTGLAEPQRLLWTLANRLRDGDLARLRLFSGPPGYHAADSLCAPDIAHKVERICQFVGPTGRDNGFSLVGR
ncbi:MAG: hypothetical protein VX681_15540 [Myxococcota bacterium]|nr:hypothetical protein [Myxococcota bacterium]